MYIYETGFYYPHHNLYYIVSRNGTCVRSRRSCARE